MSGFLNLDDDDEPLSNAEAPERLGSGLKSRKKVFPPPKPDRAAVAEAGRAHGFDRTTGDVPQQTTRRVGRPARKEPMEYWRIWINSDLRTELTAISEQEDVRLNDLLVEMLQAYKSPNQK